MDEVHRYLREKQVPAPDGLGEFELADHILDHEEHFRAEQRLLFMLLVVLIEPFDQLCREHLRANCLLLNPVDLAEATIVGIISDLYFQRRRKPLRPFARQLIARTATQHAHDRTMFLWQPDEPASANSRVLHIACGIVNDLPIDARRVVRLVWVDQTPWHEVEAITGRHPEEIERILEQIVKQAQIVASREPPMRPITEADGDHEEGGHDG